ncbi:MAG: hypothetical protein WA944_01825 [Mycobacterium sp.]
MATLGGAAEGTKRGLDGAIVGRVGGEEFLAADIIATAVAESLGERARAALTTTGYGPDRKRRAEPPTSGAYTAKRLTRHRRLQLLHQTPVLTRVFDGSTNSGAASCYGA